MSAEIRWCKTCKDGTPHTVKNAQLVCERCGTGRVQIRTVTDNILTTSGVMAAKAYAAQDA
jgi:Zn finger protein HypA/HybF involved in hydrogenase expression